MDKKVKQIQCAAFQDSCVFLVLTEDGCLYKGVVDKDGNFNKEWTQMSAPQEETDLKF